jgi:hypothetical protein
MTNPHQSSPESRTFEDNFDACKAALALGCLMCGTAVGVVLDRLDVSTTRESLASRIGNGTGDVFFNAAHKLLGSDKPQTTVINMYPGAGQQG